MFLCVCVAIFAAVDVIAQTEEGKGERDMGGGGTTGPNPEERETWGAEEGIRL